VVVKLQRNADDVITLDFNSAAVTEESTPPDMATTTWCPVEALEIQTVEHGSVVDAIAAAPSASRSGNFRAVPEKRIA